MQSGDLKTLLSLNTTVGSVAPEFEYRSTHDRKELEVLSQGQGLGSELYDDGSRDADEFAAFADELGIPIERE